MIGLLLRFSFRKCSSTPIPSSFGIIISSNTTSGCLSLMMRNASSPLSALAITSISLSCSNSSVIISTVLWLSSAIATLILFISSPPILFFSTFLLYIFLVYKQPIFLRKFWLISKGFDIIRQN